MDEYYAFLYMRKNQPSTIHVLLTQNVDFSRSTLLEETDLKMQIDFDSMLYQSTEFRLNCKRYFGKTMITCLIYNREQAVQEVNFEIKVDSKTILKSTLDLYLVPPGYSIEKVSSNGFHLVVLGRSYSKEYKLFFFELSKHTSKGPGFAQFSYEVKDLYQNKDAALHRGVQIKFKDELLILATGGNELEGPSESLYQVFKIEDFKVNLTCIERSCLSSYYLSITDGESNRRSVARLTDYLGSVEDRSGESYREVINLWVFGSCLLPFLILSIKALHSQTKRHQASLLLMRLGTDWREPESQMAVDLWRQDTSDLSAVVLNNAAMADED